MLYSNVSSKTLYVVQRDDDVPIRFHGVMIGSATEETDEPFVRHQVSVFKTETGYYVVAQYRAHALGRRATQSASWFGIAKSVILGLRDSQTDKLSVAAVNALRQAAENDPQIAEAFARDLD